ncbi:MAG: glucose-1-phosphate adenylyltransferase [Defluviitaleaceae bacterium]|nr:glucose-1-phosphate adenylyltransferase [Defluviitaleaceae bacterium]
MRKKEMIALLLAGGQGSRLGVLTEQKAKPAVSFGGKYKIIDFPMSNCINSGIDTVGVLTQYEPLSLNRHIGIGIPWDLDRRSGGVTILAPHLRAETGAFYSGTANAIFQNMQYLESNNPENVLILSGDHIYKMDYAKMLAFHKRNNADVTIAVLEVPMEEACRFGIMNTDVNDKIYEFVEKPEQPVSNLASMGIYIFNYSLLKEALNDDNKIHPDSDFGKHIIPMLLEREKRLFAYRFKYYWKDVGTIESYWQANMELIKTLPDFNLYEDFWRIYTSDDHQPPTYMGESSDIRTSIVSEGCEIYGSVVHSILGTEVFVDEGAVIKDSIIMDKCHIGKGAVIDRAIIDSEAVIGENVTIGFGENIANELKPHIYDSGISVVGHLSVIPDNVTVGKNCVVYGDTKHSDYRLTENGLELPSGGSVIIESEGGI